MNKCVKRCRSIIDREIYPTVDKPTTVPFIISSGDMRKIITLELIALLKSTDNDALVRVDKLTENHENYYTGSSVLDLRERLMRRFWKAIADKELRSADVEIETGIPVKIH